MNDPASVKLGPCPVCGETVKPCGCQEISPAEFQHPSFSVHRYDPDGDKIDTGIWLHYGETSIKVAESLNGFKAYAIYIMSMIDEIADNF